MASTRVVAVKFLAFAAGSLVLLGLLYNTMTHGVGGDNSDYEAVFTDVNGLRTGDDVRVAGVKVGEVTEIDVDDGQALVSFEVADDHRLTSTTGLVLRYQNLIGQRYLALVPGESVGEELPKGATIPVSRTSGGFNLTALLNGFRPLFQVLKPADINTLSESIIKVLQGEGGTVASLLRETTDLTNYVADRDQVFHEVATNLTPLLQQISGESSNLSGTVRELSRLTAGLARDKDTLANSLVGLEALVHQTDEIVREIRAPLGRDIATLRKVVAMYAENSGPYAASFKHFGNLLDALGRTASYRGALTMLLCDVSVHLGDVSVPIGAPDGKHSEVCR